MFYNCEQRQHELDRIIAIPYEGVKIHALQTFIEDERAILSKMQPPPCRSQALDTATQLLHHLENPREINPQVARRLF